MTADPPSDPTRRAQIVHRHVHGPDEAERVSELVECTTLGKVVPLEDCQHCPKWVATVLDPREQDSHVECLAVAPAALVDRSAALAAEPAALPEALATEQVSAIMSRRVICVDPEMRLEELNLLLAERGFGGAPVVDGRGRAVGVVSKTDIVWSAYQLDGEAAAFGEDPDGRPLCVRDVMSGAAITIGGTRPILEAAALMARERVHRLPVVNETGEVIGVLSTLDVVTWIAARSGHRAERRHPRK
jgi:CBS domain-containing protein